MQGGVLQTCPKGATKSYNKIDFFHRGEFLLQICTSLHKQTSSKWVIIIIVIYWMVELFYVISLSE